MKILLVGNGFDLAHALPTDYGSFIKFLCAVQLFVPETSCQNEYSEFIEKSNFCKEFKQFLLNPYELYKDNHFDELRSLIFENAWVKYFEPVGRKNNTWISFEAEISRVVQLLDNYRKSTDKNERRQIFMGQLFPVYGRMGICDKDNICSISDEIIINKLLVDLGRLIRCLEIYLCLCSKIIRITNKLQAVLKIGTVDKILSFNYTDTFENVYQPLLEKAPEYCYIHGHAKLSNTIDSNNMVLGIDEYLDENVRNEETTFVCFKKFYQRIFKQTDFNYMNWVNKRAGTKDLYIIGHSLDVTDKDVLQDILTQPGVHTTIFYHTKSANGDQIMNLIKVLGYDALNALTRGRSSSSITFQELS